MRRRAKKETTRYFILRGEKGKRMGGKAEEIGVLPVGILVRGRRGGDEG